MIQAILLFPLLILFLVFELLKIFFFMPLYPLAYLWRRQLRVKRTAGKTPLLWMALDDSIHDKSLARGFDVEYCDYGKRAPLGFITERLPEGKFKEFARSFNWSAVRNSSVNLTIVFEKWVGEMVKVKTHYGSDKFFYEVRQFPRFCFPYFAWNFFESGQISAGWISCGRYQARFRLSKDA